MLHHLTLYRGSTMIKVITAFGLEEIAHDQYLTKGKWVGNQNLSNRPPVYYLYYFTENTKGRNWVIFSNQTWAEEYCTAIEINGKQYHFKDIHEKFNEIRIMIEQDKICDMIEANLP